MTIYKAVTRHYTENFETEYPNYFRSLESAKKYVDKKLHSVCRLNRKHRMKANVVFIQKGGTHFLRFEVKRNGFPQTTVSPKGLKAFVETDYTFEIPFAIVEIEVQ